MSSPQSSRAVHAGLNKWLIFRMAEVERNKILAGLFAPTTYKVVSKLMVGPPVPNQTIGVFDTLDEGKATLAGLAAGARSRPEPSRPDVQLSHDGCMLEFRYHGETQAQMRFWIKGHVDGDEEEEKE